MKIATRLLKLLLVFACAAFSTTAFGQATQIWTGGGDGTNIDQAANWGGTLPSTANSDTAEFNGLTTSNLFLINNTALFASGPGQSGISVYLTGSQTNSINIASTLSPLSQGFAVWNVTLDPGAAALTLGSTDSTRVFYMPQRPSGAIHTYMNNSTNTATINPYVRFISGGGAAYTFDFTGTGNWQVNNFMQPDNNGGAVSIQVDGPGTTTWNPIGYFGTDAIGTVTVNGGQLVLTGPHSRLTGRPITINGGAFNFNAPAQAQTLTGTISGGGTNIITAGTLTLSGANTYSGDTVIAGGEVIANRAENPGSSGPLGANNIIDLNGGTLGYSVNNSFDYSSRFSTAPNQAYNIDTAGQIVTFASPLTSSGGSLTKIGAGTLTLSGANTYNGPTTVSAGKLVIQGSAGTGSISVADGAALDFTENGSIQIKPSTLVLGASASVVMEFNNVTNSVLPPLAASGTITTPVGSPVTININSGQFNTIGQVFPLFSWGSGSAPAVTLGNVSGAAGTLSTNGNEIVLTITSTPYVWTGGTSGTWDKTTAGNWQQSGTPKTFIDGVLALFDDTALLNTNITISGLVQPSSLTFDNDTNAYTVNSTTGNDIAGSTGLTVSGAGSVTVIGGANTYTGVTTVSGGGTLSVSSLANGGAPSDIGQSANSAANVVLNGGTLQYTGGDTAIDRLFSIGSAGATIDASGTGSLSLTNTGTIGLSGGGPRTLTLEGSASNLLAANIVDAAGGNGTALTKHGTGLWVLTGTNTQTGVTLVNQGVLQIGIGGASGTLGNGNVVDDTGIDFVRTGSLTVPGGISGSGSVTNDGTGTVILAGNNSYAGGTFINAGTVQFGNGGSGGTVNGNAPIVDNGTLVFNSTSAISISGFGNTITGTGNVIVKSGFVDSEQGNTYTGWTEIDAGATFQPCKGQTGGMLTSVITNNGTLKFFSQNTPATFGISNNIVGTGRVFMDTANQNAGNAVIAGTNNTYSGGTWIGGAVLNLGDGITPGAGSIVGPIWFTNTTGPNINTFSTSKRLIFNRFDNFIFTNIMTSKVSDGSSAANSGSVEQMGPGMVTLTGNNSYPGDTTVDANMIMQVGNGGASGTIGTGPVVNNGTLIFNRSGTLIVPGAFSGGGVVVQQGTGTTIMAGTNIDSGSITVSNGTLRISTMYQGNAAIAVQDGATFSVTNTGNAGTALINSLTMGSVSGPSTLEFMNVGDPTTRVISAGALTLNGNVTIKLVGSGGLIAGNTYPLVGYGALSTSGTFSLSLPAGVTGTLTNDTVNSWIALNVTTATFTAPTIQKATLSGTNIVINATNNLGNGNQTYVLLSSTSIKTPLTNWTVFGSGFFNQDGSLSITNPVSSGNRFFILRTP